MNWGAKFFEASHLIGENEVRVSKEVLDGRRHNLIMMNKEPDKPECHSWLNGEAGTLVFSGRHGLLCVAEI